MQLSWAHFLSNHPSAADLDVISDSIQTYFASNATAEQKFFKLCDSEALLLIRSPVPEQVQITYHHTYRKDSFQQAEPFMYGVMGLVTKAIAVRTDPKLIFKRTHQKKHVPFMAHFTACSSIPEVQAIDLDKNHTQFVWKSTVLPPYIYKGLLHLDDWRADTILLHIINIILDQWQSGTNAEALEPNENILTLVNQSSPISIQTLLHLECARVGLMAHFPLELCTALKNGCLVSSPRPSSLNNLCFFCVLQRATGTPYQQKWHFASKNRPHMANLQTMT